MLRTISSIFADFSTRFRPPHPLRSHKTKFNLPHHLRRHPLRPHLLRLRLHRPPPQLHHHRPPLPFTSTRYFARASALSLRACARSPSSTFVATSPHSAGRNHCAAHRHHLHPLRHPRPPRPHLHPRPRPHPARRRQRQHLCPLPSRQLPLPMRADRVNTRVPQTRHLYLHLHHLHHRHLPHLLHHRQHHQRTARWTPRTCGGGGAAPTNCCGCRPASTSHCAVALPLCRLHRLLLLIIPVLRLCPRPLVLRSRRRMQTAAGL